MDWTKTGWTKMNWTKSRSTVSFEVLVDLSINLVNSTEI